MDAYATQRPIPMGSAQDKKRRLWIINEPVETLPQGENGAQRHKNVGWMRGCLEDFDVVLDVGGGWAAGFVYSALVVDVEREMENIIHVAFVCVCVCSFVRVRGLVKNLLSHVRVRAWLPPSCIYLPGRPTHT